MTSDLDDFHRRVRTWLAQRLPELNLEPDDLGTPTFSLDAWINYDEGSGEGVLVVEALITNPAKQPAPSIPGLFSNVARVELSSSGVAVFHQEIFAL